MILPFILRLADDALIYGHRVSEWCGHGPILEQDIALTNTALDHIGRARSLYQYAANLCNAMPLDKRSALFTSVAIQNIITSGANLEEDHLAYLRDGWDFKNTLLVEHPNVDWAYTITRAFFFDAFNFELFHALSKSTDSTIAAIAAKSIKEITYHLRWSSEWVIRLGDGTDESKAKLETAVQALWSFTGEPFVPTEYEIAMAQAGIAPDVSSLKAAWMQRIQQIFTAATISVPTENWMHNGGKNGIHTEQLGYILAELQFMQRAYPGMTW